MRSSVAISILLHAVIVGALMAQWHAVTVAHKTDYVYSVKILGPEGGGGSGGPGSGARIGYMAATMVARAPKPKARETAEATEAVPKKPESRPEQSEVSVPAIDVGAPEGILPIGDGGGGGGGGAGGGWGTGIGRGRGPGRGTGLGIVEPKPLFIPWPKYPSGVKAIPSGRVELMLLVNEQGEVEDVKVTHGLPVEQLNAIALQTARKIRFTPGLENGARVAMWVRLAIGFQPR